MTRRIRSPASTVNLSFADSYADFFPGLNLAQGPHWLDVSRGEHITPKEQGRARPCGAAHGRQVTRHQGPHWMWTLTEHYLGS